MRFTALVLVTLGLHVGLGWIWGIAGGIVAGWVWTRGGWWKGAAVVGVAWALLVGYSILVTTGPSMELHSILGDILGGIPDWSVPILVVCVGGSIGLAGGLIGAVARRMVPVAET